MEQAFKQGADKDDYGINCTDVISSSGSSTSSPPSPPSVSAHVHPFAEIVYAIDINADIVIDNTSFRIRSGDIAVIAPNTAHSKQISGNGHYFSIVFPHDLLFSSRSGLPEYIPLGKFISPSFGKFFFEKSQIESTDIYDTLHEIMNEWETKQEGFEQIIRSDIIKVLTKLHRIGLEEDKLMYSLHNDTISRALTHIAGNYSSATERSVAEHCGLSLSYFSTLFKSSVGETFNDYLTRIKLDRAKSLLISTDKSMTFIAFETGFSSSSHFIARFKEFEGTTPSRYRSDVRSGKIRNIVKHPQFAVCFENIGKPSGKYLIIKYRTNRSSDPTWLPFFIETNSSYPTGKGLTWAVIEGDEQWHVIIIDMSRTMQLTDAFTQSEDGKYYAGHLAIHPFYKSVLPTLYFDIAYAALAESLEHALGLIGDGEDILFGHFSTENGDHWIRTEIDSEVIPQSKQSIFYTSGKKLLEGAVETGFSLRKIKLLSENDTEFLRVWCI